MIAGFTRIVLQAECLLLYSRAENPSERKNSQAGGLIGLVRGQRRAQPPCSLRVKKDFSAASALSARKTVCISCHFVETLKFWMLEFSQQSD